MKTLSFWKKSLYSALVFFGTLIILSVGYATWNATMSKVSSGNPLSAAGWNALVDNIADLDSRWSRSGGNIVFTGGNVGIGTASPVALLHINDASGAVSLLKLSGKTSGSISHTIQNTSGIDNWQINTGVDGYGIIDGTQSSYRMMIDNYGHIGMGKVPSGTYTLEVNGPVAGTSWTNLSDQRFKKNITPLSSALDTVEKLQGVTFDWRVGEFKDRNFPEGKQVGFIAQEVEKVIPEVVTTDKQGYKGVEYANITAVLVEAVKEQQKQLKEQQNQITALQQEVRALKNGK